MIGVRYTAPLPKDGGESYQFEVITGSRTTKVGVSREAIEDFARQPGLLEPTTAAERLHFVEAFQPELKQLALDKCFPGMTAVLITSADIVD